MRKICFLLMSLAVAATALYGCSEKDEATTDPRIVLRTDKIIKIEHDVIKFTLGYKIVGDVADKVAEAVSLTDWITVKKVTADEVELSLGANEGMGLREGTIELRGKGVQPLTITFRQGGLLQIIVENDEIVIGRAAKEAVVRYTLLNAPERAKVNAVSESDWLQVKMIYRDSVSFTVDPEGAGVRTGSVKLSYEEAEDVRVYIRQTNN